MIRVERTGDWWRGGRKEERGERVAEGGGREGGVGRRGETEAIEGRKVRGRQESGKKSEEEREKWVNSYTLVFSIIHYLSKVQQWLHWKC